MALGWSLPYSGHGHTLRVAEHWHRLPRVVVDSPSLGTFQVRLDRTLSMLVKLKVCCQWQRHWTR